MKQSEIPIFKSLQDFFEFVITSLFRQGSISINKFGKCMYRMHDTGGNKCCLFGFVIPDEVYIPKIEYRSVTGLLNKPLNDNGGWQRYLETQPVLSNPSNLDIFYLMQRHFHDSLNGYYNTRSEYFLNRVESFVLDYDDFGLNSRFVANLRDELQDDDMDSSGL